MRDNPGMTQEQARVAVDRDNLAASIRSGLVREDAREIVAKMTDAQVTALCPNGNPPAFEPVKRIPGGTRAEPKYEPEKWNHGLRGGVVHIDRNASAEHILEIAKTTNSDLIREKAAAIERAGASDGTPLTLAPISEKDAEEIEAICGVAPKSLEPTIDGNEIQHTFNRHGKKRTVNGKVYGERNKKQVPITAADIARIPEIIAHRDHIEKGNPEKSRKLQSVKFVKTYPDGTNYAVFVSPPPHWS